MTDYKKLHRELYQPKEPMMVAVPEMLKTVIRHPVKPAIGP